MYLGDYWEINGNNWRIMDFDYWWGTGDNNCLTHHLVIMPDFILFNAKMNDTNTTDGGYLDSKMNRTYLNDVIPTIKSVFGDTSILVHKEILINEVTNGHPSRGAFYDVEIALPSEIMMYGCPILSQMSNGEVIAYNLTTNKTQLAALRANPAFINPGRQTQWLRDVAYAIGFACIHSRGNSDYFSAINEYGVRPAFAIKG